MHPDKQSNEGIVAVPKQCSITASDKGIQGLDLIKPFGVSDKRTREIECTPRLATMPHHRLLAPPPPPATTNYRH